jgi:hypothetical protein
MKLFIAFLVCVVSIYATQPQASSPNQKHIHLEDTSGLSDDEVRQVAKKN